MQSRRSFLLSLVSVPIVLAACGSDDKSSSTTAAPGTTAGGSSTTGAATTGAPTTAAATAAATTAAAAATTTATAGSTPPPPATVGHACASATSRTSPTPRRSSASQSGIFAKALGDERQARDDDVQRRHRRRSRRCSPTPSTPRSSARTRRSTASPSPTARRSGSSPGATSGGAFLVVKPDINARRRPQGQDARDAAARQHPGRRPAHLAEGPGPRAPTPHGGGDVSIMPAGQRRHARRVQDGRRSTAPGCPSRGRPGW